MSLDLAVSRAVAKAVLLESALHSDETWHIGIGSTRRQAVRHVHEHGVTFRACFLDAPDEEWMVLYEGDVARSTLPVTRPDGDGEFCIAWDLSLQEAVPA